MASGCFRCGLRIAAVDEDGPAAGPTPGLDVAPTVPDHDAAPKFRFRSSRGLEQHARAWLPAITSVRVVMRADVDRIDRQGAQQEVMECRSTTARSCAPGRYPVGWSRPAGRTRPDGALAGFRHPRQDAELLECRWGMGPPVADGGPVDARRHGRRIPPPDPSGVSTLTTAFRRGRRRAWRRVMRAAPPSYPWCWTNRACESGRCSGGRPEHHPSIPGRRR